MDTKPMPARMSCAAEGPFLPRVVALAVDLVGDCRGLVGLTGVFMLVDAVDQAGLPKDFARLTGRIGLSNPVVVSV